MPTLNWITAHAHHGASGPGLRGQPLSSVESFRADPAPQLLLPNAARFRDPKHASRPLRPFPAYVQQPTPIGPAPDDWETTPNFAIVGKGHATRALVEIPIAPGTSLYGTGEQAGPLLRNGTRKVTWNHDAYDYNDRTPHLYQAHPWVLAVRPDGSAFGVFVESTRRVVIDLRSSIRFEIPLKGGASSPPAVVIEGDTPEDVLRALAKLTGTMALPPRWALGYHQCRYSYYPESRVRAIAEGFRDRQIPCDVIWLDIDYMHGFRCFTWDSTHFPNPKALIDDLHAQGFKVVCMIDPGLKVDPEYSVYAQGLKGDHFVRHAVGPASSNPTSHATTDTPAPLVGKVWPGDCSFPDFTRARTRQWWAGLYKDFLSTGIDGVWNDMNEPALFGGFVKSMPDDALHDADPDLGGPGTHADYHNIYGMQMVRATLDGVRAAKPDVRPFVLTRANFLGGHRYAATWTGDNRSNWTHLAWSIPMVLNLGLSGQGFSGPDIGGFAGNANGPLLARWLGIGCLLPFARGHAETNGVDHEPWSFGPACEATARRAIERRMRLLPYLYTLFYEASTTGLPPMRPLFFADPEDPRLRAVDSAFLLGRDLLVRCDTSPGPAPATSSHARLVPSQPMPQGRGGDWLPFEPLPHHDPELPDLFLRAGAILPMGPVAQWSEQSTLDPLTLVVALDAAGEAQGTLYEDDGDGFAYQKGDFALTTFHAQSHAASATKPARVEVTVASRQGSRRATRRQIKVVLLRRDSTGATSSLTAHGHEGAPISVPLPAAAAVSPAPAPIPSH
jgi:alpha-glucosidase